MLFKPSASSLASLQLELSAWTKTSADMEKMCHNQHPFGLIYLDNIIGKTNKHCNIVVFSKRGDRWWPCFTLLLHRKKLIISGASHGLGHHSFQKPKKKLLQALLCWEVTDIITHVILNLGVTNRRLEDHQTFVVFSKPGERKSLIRGLSHTY